MLYVILIVIVFAMLIYALSRLSLSAALPAIPLGLPAIAWPSDNPYNREKADLGKLLYFDKRLSMDNTISCASCHSPDKTFTDHLPMAIGIMDRKEARKSPTVINAAYYKHLFWDGRAGSLEEQAKGPISNPEEMTLIDNAHLAQTDCESIIRSIPGYHALFKKAFGNEDCSIAQIAQAIATFERTILSGNSPYDQYMAGNPDAMTEEEKHGMHIFNASCVHCHSGPTFSNGSFVNIGVGMDQEKPDLGRFRITHDEQDWGAFKVPGLREVVHTYPYMHNGQFQTLEEVVDYYDKGGNPNPNLHPLMRPLHLSEKDKKAVVSFLKALSGEGWQMTEPSSFP
jgi:cytochrome c peroxidase